MCQISMLLEINYPILEIIKPIVKGHVCFASSILVMECVLRKRVNVIRQQEERLMIFFALTSIDEKLTSSQQTLRFTFHIARFLLLKFFFLLYLVARILHYLSRACRTEIFSVYETSGDEVDFRIVYGCVFAPIC